MYQFLVLSKLVLLSLIALSINHKSFADHPAPYVETRHFRLDHSPVGRNIQDVLRHWVPHEVVFIHPTTKQGEVLPLDQETVSSVKLLFNRLDKHYFNFGSTKPLALSHAFDITGKVSAFLFDSCFSDLKWFSTVDRNSFKGFIEDTIFNKTPTLKLYDVKEPVTTLLSNMIFSLAELLELNQTISFKDFNTNVELYFDERLNNEKHQVIIFNSLNVFYDNCLLIEAIESL